MSKWTAIIQDLCRLALTATAAIALWILVPQAAEAIHNASALLWNAGQLTATLNQQVQANAQDIRAIVTSSRRIAGQGEAIAANVNGVTASVNSMAYKAAQPQTTGQKIVAGLKIGALIVSKFVP